MSLRPTDAAPPVAPPATAGGGTGRSLAAVLAAGQLEPTNGGMRELKRAQKEERERGWIPMSLSMLPPRDPMAAAWTQEMLISKLGTPKLSDVLLTANIAVDQDIVHTLGEVVLADAKIAIERKVTPRELWNMQVEVSKALAKLYRDMEATIGELFSHFKSNDNPDIRKQQDEIDKYASHKHYFKAMRLAVNRLFDIARLNDSPAPPAYGGYRFDDGDQEDTRKAKNLALGTFRQRWVVRAGEAALLEAVRRHIATL